MNNYEILIFLVNVIYLQAKNVEVTQNFYPNRDYSAMNSAKYFPPPSAVITY